MDTATQKGSKTTEFKAMIGGSVAVICAFVVGKVSPDSGVSVSETELIAALSSLIGVYMAVRGWTKSSALKAQK